MFILFVLACQNNVQFVLQVKWLLSLKVSIAIKYHNGFASISLLNHLNIEVEALK